MLSMKLPVITATIIDNVDSDISVGMAAKIATKAVGLSGESINTYLLPGAPQTVEGASFWFADTEQTATMINEIYAIKPADDSNTSTTNSEDASGMENGDMEDPTVSGRRHRLVGPPVPIIMFQKA